MKNIIMNFSWINITRENPIDGFILSTLIANTLCYPLLTVMRRLQCQSKFPGMIPLRYSGGFHCFKLILNEEGLLGIYKGYLAFIIQVFNTYKYKERDYDSIFNGYESISLYLI